MSSDDALRAIARYLEDADKRERAAEQRHKALVDTIGKSTNLLAKELRDGFLLLDRAIRDALHR